MNWIIDAIPTTRAAVETYDAFIARNLEWWRLNESHERACRQPYYVNFIKRTGLIDVLNDGVSVAEVGPGPFGGMLEVCNLRALRKTFIDYALIHLVTLSFIKWPYDATYVHAAAESIPLRDDAVDLLVSYNAIDHGWDTLRALNECVRISKMSCVSFDCRGDSPNEAEYRAKIHDRDHMQMMKFSDIEAHADVYRKAGYECEVYDLGNKPNQWPVATIIVKKPVLVNAQVPARGIETRPFGITRQPVIQGE